MFTLEIVKQLEQPLPLDEGHEVRVQQELQNGTRAQWLVYTTEDPIRARLNEVDPGWGDRLANITLTSTAATVALEMTVLGVTRLGIGGASVKRSQDDVDQDVAKAAATDAFKRAARMFGIGAYLLRTPIIYTDWAPIEKNMSQDQKKAAYAARDRAAREAKMKFADWYRKQFVKANPAKNGHGSDSDAEALAPVLGRESAEDEHDPERETPEAAQDGSWWDDKDHRKEFHKNKGLMLKSAGYSTDDIARALNWAKYNEDNLVDYVKAQGCEHAGEAIALVRKLLDDAVAQAAQASA